MSENDELTLLEIHHILVLLRMHRHTIIETQMALEEKRRLGWDGATEQALLVCANETHLLNVIVSKLWRMEMKYRNNL